MAIWAYELPGGKERPMDLTGEPAGLGFFLAAASDRIGILYAGSLPTRIFLLDPETGRVQPPVFLDEDFLPSRLTGCGERFLALGGTDASRSPSVVNRVATFDPGSGVWMAAHPLLKKRQAFGVVAMGGKLYVAGGSDGLKSALPHFEEYVCPP